MGTGMGGSPPGEDLRAIHGALVDAQFSSALITTTVFWQVGVKGTLSAAEWFSNLYLGGGTTTEDTDQFKCGSCEVAARERATNANAAIKDIVQTYGLGARIGIVGDYRPFGDDSTSWHTYTVVELYDKSGRIVAVAHTDNYLGIPYVRWVNYRPNWTDKQNALMYDIPPRR
jgi:hypothetical protein